MNSNPTIEGAREIDDVTKIAHAGAVRCRVVVPYTDNSLQLARCHRGDKRTRLLGTPFESSPVIPEIWAPTGLK